MIAFILGAILGGFFGMVTMACFAAARRYDAETAHHIRERVQPRHVRQ
jgi:H+/Cl- antiporter ClcA